MVGRSVIGTVLVTALLAVSPVEAQPSNAWVGSWRLDVDRSKFSPGPPPRSRTLRIEPVDGGQKITFDGINADGQPTHSEIITNFDGTEVPIRSAASPAKTVSTDVIRRLDERSFEARTRVDGKPTTTHIVVISPDGRTMTETITGANIRGQPVNNMLVFDRQ
jgi:hypothetical protein